MTDANKNEEEERPIYGLPKGAGARPAVIALTRILGEVADVAKDQRLKAKYTHDYRSKEAIFDVFRRRLAVAGLFPRVSAIEHRQIEQPQGKGTALFTVTKFEIEFIHGESGDSVRSTWYGEAADTNDKGTNKTFTAGLRTYFENQFMLSEFAEDEVDYEYQREALTGPTHDVKTPKAPAATVADLFDLFADNDVSEDDTYAYLDRHIAAVEDVEAIEDVTPERLAFWRDGMAKLGRKKFQATVAAKLDEFFGEPEDDEGEPY